MAEDDRRAYFAHAAGQLPTRRIATAEDVADAVVLAATNRNLTGTVIETDGAPASSPSADPRQLTCVS